jgi:uncharacterized repeat protein (TIGR03847 family)
MNESFDLREPGRFTVGAMGEPGQRLFYFQAFAHGTEVAVKCEKQQAQALAEHLMRLVPELEGAAPVGVDAAEALPPGELAWIVGSISLGLDRDANRIVVVLEEFPDEEADEPSSLEVAELRVHLTAEQAAAYAAQMQALLEVGRPLCRLCERPIDPTGHACPRLN